MNLRISIMLLCFLVTGLVKAEITLPKIFSNEMVLQRETNVLLYGWADPNEEFTIYTSWNDATVVVKTGNNAKWKVTVETPKAGGPFQIRFKGKTNEITLKDVLIGEVWLFPHLYSQFYYLHSTPYYSVQNKATPHLSTRLLM